jgi:RNA polymerase sigma factor (sigma-70 family)
VLALLTDRLMCCAASPAESCRIRVNARRSLCLWTGQEVPFVGKGEDPAFARLFEAEYPGLVNEVRLVLGDREAAEDAVQEAFTLLLRHWGKVGAYDRPGAWVRRVAIRHALRAGRRRALAERLLPRLDPPQAPAGAADPDLETALRGLPRMQRAVVVLHYLDDLSCDEVAGQLGCRPATVRVHLHRARQKLALVLGEEADRVAG